MKKSLLALAILLNSTFGISQFDSTFTIIEKPARFRSGYPELKKYISSELKTDLVTSKDCGYFIVSFLVEKDGTLSDIQFKKGCSDVVFQRRVLAVFKEMPRWTPAQYKGEPVRTAYTIPFRIESE